MHDMWLEKSWKDTLKYTNTTYSINIFKYITFNHKQNEKLYLKEVQWYFWLIARLKKTLTLHCSTRDNFEGVEINLKE